MTKGNEPIQLCKSILYKSCLNPFTIVIIEETVLHNNRASTVPYEIITIDDKYESLGDHISFFLSNIISQASNLNQVELILNNTIKHERRHIEQILYMRENNLDVISLLIKERSLHILEQDAIDYTKNKINDLSIIIKRLCIS